MNRARQETGEQRFFNDRIGIVEELDASGIKAGFAGQNPSVWVEPRTWENRRYTLNKETPEICCGFFPGFQGDSGLFVCDIVGFQRGRGVQ